MANFDEAFPYIYENEKGVVNNPADPGGLTNDGITYKLAVHHGICSEEDFLNMSIGTKKMIYRKEFWRFDEIESQAVATKLLDMCVNMGLKTGIILLQKELLGMKAGVVVDGIIGPKTIACVNQIKSVTLVKALCFAARDYYDSLIKKNPKLAVFKKGWYNRAMKYPR